MPRPAWIVEHGTRERDGIRLAALEDFLRLFGLGNQANRDHRDIDLLLQARRERQLVPRPEGNLLLW